MQELILEVLNRKKSSARLEDIKEGVSLTRDLGIDSLDVLQITATVEKRYKFRIPEEELKGMDDLKGILSAVSKYWPPKP